jgi:hypothetical protein
MLFNFRMLRLSSRAIVFAPLAAIAALTALSYVRSSRPLAIGTTATTGAEVARHLRVDEKLQQRCATRDDIGGLTDCLTRGPLATSQIKLVGLVDPRETPRRATEIGLARATQLKSVLVSRGVPADRIIVSSRQDPAAVDDASLVEVRPPEVD